MNLRALAHFKFCLDLVTLFSFILYPILTLANPNFFPIIGLLGKNSACAIAPHSQVTYIGRYTSTDPGYVTKLAVNVNTAYRNQVIVLSVASSDNTPSASITSIPGVTWREVFPGGWNTGSALKVWTFVGVFPNCVSSQPVEVNFTNNIPKPRLIASVFSGVDVSGSSQGMGYHKMLKVTSTTSASDTFLTTRPNSLITSQIGSIGLKTFTVGGLETLIDQFDNGLGMTNSQARFSNITTNVTSSVTTTYSWSGNDTAVLSSVELLGPLSPTNVPVVDQYFSGDNGGGAATLTISNVSTSEDNELLLLAVTWKNNSTMSTAPNGAAPTGWTSVGSAVEGATNTTQLWRALVPNKIENQTITVTVPGGVKATAVVIAIRGVDTSGTNGSGAVDVVNTGNGSTANPSTGLTVSTNGSLVLGFLGNGNATAPTALGAFTLNASVSSSGGGGATTKTTTSVISSNQTYNASATPSAAFTLSAINWTEVVVAIKAKTPP
jgi:hypothetical protein